MGRFTLSCASHYFVRAPPNTRYLEIWVADSEQYSHITVQVKAFVKFTLGMISLLLQAALLPPVPLLRRWTLILHPD